MCIILERSVRDLTMYGLKPFTRRSSEEALESWESG